MMTMMIMTMMMMMMMVMMMMTMEKMMMKRCCICWCSDRQMIHATGVKQWFWVKRYWFSLSSSWCWFCGAMLLQPCSKFNQCATFLFYSSVAYFIFANPPCLLSYKAPLSDKTINVGKFSTILACANITKKTARNVNSNVTRVFEMPNCQASWIKFVQFEHSKFLIT